MIHSYVLSEFSFRNVRTDVTAGKEGGAGGLTTATGVWYVLIEEAGLFCSRTPTTFSGVGKSSALAVHGRVRPPILSALGVCPAG